MNPWRSTATALTLFIWPGPIPPYLIHNVISFCASHPLGFHRSAEQKCPEGAKACSLGLALFASPRSTTTHNTHSPEGATAVRWSSSQWRSSMRVMKHLLLEPRTRRGSRKSCRRPFGTWGFWGPSPTWGWQKAPAPGYMPELLRSKNSWYQRYRQLHP